jgi:hypothetical protein
MSKTKPDVDGATPAAKKAKNATTKPGFSFTDTELKILANFASINPSMIITPAGFEVINNSKSVIGFYKFETPYTYEQFGLYETPEFLTALSAIDQPAIEVKDKFVQISGKADKLKYYTTAQELLPKVPNVSEKFAKVTLALEFSLSADKLAILNKMANILKAKFIFFETDGDAVRVTVADELESSANSYNILITDGIKQNELANPVKIALADFKLMPGDYEIKLAEKISRWESMTGVEYYVGVAV